jgi:hypothetical protein
MLRFWSNNNNCGSEPTRESGLSIKSEYSIVAHCAGCLLEVGDDAKETVFDSAKMHAVVNPLHVKVWTISFPFIWSFLLIYSVCQHQCFSVFNGVIQPLEHDFCRI